MTRFLQGCRRWVPSAMIALFLLGTVTFPPALSMAYSGRSDAPDHILTYTENKLTWDKNTVVDRETGAAELSLFHAHYDDNVEEKNGNKVIAPGTKGMNVVRLKNEVQEPITYTAVFYQINSTEELPVKSSLSGENFADTEHDVLPDGLGEEYVLRTVTGELRGQQIQDFDISWEWVFETDDNGNVVDTILGKNPDANKVTVGLLITVEDNNDYSSKGKGSGHCCCWICWLDWCDDICEACWFCWLLTILLIAAIITVLVYLLTKKKDPKEEEATDENEDTHPGA